MHNLYRFHKAVNRFMYLQCKGFRILMFQTGLRKLNTAGQVCRSGLPHGSVSAKEWIISTINFVPRNIWKLRSGSWEPGAIRLATVILTAHSLNPKQVKVYTDF